jgi:hypothetical protein
LRNHREGEDPAPASPDTGRELPGTVTAAAARFVDGASASDRPI